MTHLPKRATTRVRIMDRHPARRVPPGRYLAERTRRTHLKRCNPQHAAND